MEIKKVLVVEDDPADAEIVMIMLKHADPEIRPSYAGSLSVALSSLDVEPFEAVLLDLNLPDSSGLDTLSRILKKTAKVAVVVLTGIDDEKSGDSAVEQGAQDYVVKGNFTAEALRRVLRFSINRKRVQLRLQKTEELSETRNRINDLIMSTLDIDEIMNRCVGEAAKSVGEAALIGRFKECGFEVSYGYGFPGKMGDIIVPREEFKAFTALEENGIPIISVDAQADDRINPTVAKKYGVHAAMFFPLHMGRSVAGAVAFFNFSDRVFDDIETDSARMMSTSISLALENARLYEECKAASDNLIKKSSDLERSNKELEQFASIASHDLQDPLVSLASAIKVGLKRIKTIADNETLLLLSDAMNNAENMQKMVRSLLEYSKVGRQLSFENADLEKVLEVAVTNLKAVIEESGAVITHEPLPWLFVDPVLVSQLFQNLIGNAIKYRSDLRPEIHITAESRGKDYVFCIRDNGIGIPTEYRDAVFQIFERMPGVIWKPGSGIGLATCNKIVELHGGRIWIEANSGRGSSFFVSIPHQNRVALCLLPQK